MEDTKRETDWTARCFQAVLIVLVVAGHVDGADLSGPFDLFDPYSFHVAGFAFVSGYLYSEAHDCKPGAYVLDRFKRRFVPMFAIFAVYGRIATVLSHLFVSISVAIFRSARFLLIRLRMGTSLNFAIRCGLLRRLP